MTSFVRSLRALVGVELRLFTREPTAMFFSLAFPLILLLFIGSVGATDEVAPGVRFIDTYMASMVAVTAANVGIMGLSIHVAENRSRGALKRYRLSPLHPAVFFGAQFVTAAVTVAVSLLGLIVVTLALYGLSPTAHWPAFLTAAFGVLVVTVAWGMLLGGLRLPMRSVQVVSAAVFFVMFFSSGAALPRQSFPDWLQAIVQWNPLAIANDLLVFTYSGYGEIDAARLIVLALSTVVIIAVTTLTFDWEGRNS